MSSVSQRKTRWAPVLLTLVLLTVGCTSSQTQTTALPAPSAPQQAVEAVVLTPTLLFLPAADRPSDLVVVKGEAVKNLGAPGTTAQVVFQGPFQQSYPKQTTLQEARTLKKNHQAPDAAHSASQGVSGCSGRFAPPH